MLDFGSNNQLAEQFSQQLDIPDDAQDQPPNDGFTFFDSMSACTAVIDTRRETNLSFKCAQNASDIIKELMLTHNQVLSALLTQSAQLGADAWVDHETQRAKIEESIVKLSQTVLQRDNALEGAQRRAQNASTRHKSARVSKQRVDAEIQVPNSHKKYLADIGSEMIQRDRAVEAWQNAKVEANAERERGIWLSKGAQYAVSVRAAHIVERARQARTLVRLQHSLQIASVEHRRAILTYGANQSTPAADTMLVSQLAVVRLREQLREEGRQRRLLHEGELCSFRAEIRRLLEDQEAKLERTVLLFAARIARVECDNVLNCVLLCGV